MSVQVALREAQRHPEKLLWQQAPRTGADDSAAS